MKTRSILYKKIKQIPLNGSCKFDEAVQTEHTLGFKISITEVFRPRTGKTELLTDRTTYFLADLSDDGCQMLLEALLKRTDL